MIPNILALSIKGLPFDWISTENAVHYYATGKVAGDLGDRGLQFRGGYVPTILVRQQQLAT
jgi:hypothetical protein